MVRLRSAFTKDLVEAGCDEVGRGCLAGPVVAAAVILPKKFRHKLLNDSKQLNKEERLSLKEVIETQALAWAVAEVSNDEIDQINILNASFKAMHMALDKLSVKPELIMKNKIFMIRNPSATFARGRSISFAGSCGG